MEDRFASHASTQQIHGAPGQAVFDDDEETETFYITLDLTSNDEPEGTTQKPQRKDSSSSEGSPDAEDGNEDDTPAPAAGDNDTSGPSPEDFTHIQILDLHTKHPKVKYGNTIFDCAWHDEIGTELFFLPPQPQDDLLQARDNEEEDDEEQEDRPPLKMGDARYLGKSRLRLQGSVAKVRPKDMVETKAEISAMGESFRQNFEEALAERLELERSMDVEKQSRGVRPQPAEQDEPAQAMSAILNSTPAAGTPAPGTPRAVISNQLNVQPNMDIRFTEARREFRNLVDASAAGPPEATPPRDIAVPVVLNDLEDISMQDVTPQSYSPTSTVVNISTMTTSITTTTTTTTTTPIEPSGSNPLPRERSSVALHLDKSQDNCNEMVLVPTETIQTKRTRDDDGNSEKNSPKKARSDAS